MRVKATRMKAMRAGGLMETGVMDSGLAPRGAPRNDGGEVGVLCPGMTAGIVLDERWCTRRAQPEAARGALTL